MRWLKTTSQAVKEAVSQTLIDGDGRHAINGISTASIAGASKSGGRISGLLSGLLRANDLTKER